MLDKKTQTRLERYMVARKHNIARLIYILNRYFNEWTVKKWKEDGWEDIRPEQLRLISIISLEPVNIIELSKRARVTKQAMSKMVNDLISKGFIEYDTDPKDSRSKIISITKEGVGFMDYFLQCSRLLEKNFEEKIGEKKTEQLIVLLSELTESILEGERKESEGK